MRQAPGSSGLRASCGSWTPHHPLPAKVGRQSTDNRQHHGDEKTVETVFGSEDSACMSESSAGGHQYRGGYGQTVKLQQ